MLEPEPGAARVLRGVFRAAVQAVGGLPLQPLWIVLPSNLSIVLPSAFCQTAINSTTFISINSTSFMPGAGAARVLRGVFRAAVQAVGGLPLEPLWIVLPSNLSIVLPSAFCQTAINSTTFISIDSTTFMPGAGAPRVLRGVFRAAVQAVGGLPLKPAPRAFRAPHLRPRVPPEP